jgi:alanyl-tRNA synthetase
MSGVLSVGDMVGAAVDGERRARTMRNHSATHLMHKALREVLGDHVQQKGSLVDAERTRFDFSHHAPLSADEIRRIERLVNREILDNSATQARVMAFDDAVQGGAMALFGEKYGDSVRVLDIGSSRELCGGTHVGRTGDIGLFKVIAEGGVAAGVRRIEAVTGDNALTHLQSLSGTLADVAAALRVGTAELPAKIGQTLETLRALEKELQRLKSQLAASRGGDLLSQAVEVAGIKVLAARLDGADARTMRETVDQLKSRLGGAAAIVLASVEDGRVSLIAGVSADATARVKAGDLVNHVARQVGGKGGGRPDMAQAGGTDPSRLADALASVPDWVGGKAHA